MAFNLTKNIESAFVLGLYGNGLSEKKLTDFLAKHLNTLCTDLGIVLSELPIELQFSDVEFNKKVPDDTEQSFVNRHFYSKLFPEIKKTLIIIEENKKAFWDINFTPKFCYTLDKSLTPQKTKSGIFYGNLYLGHAPILYYVWVDIQQIIQTIKADTQL